MTTFITVAIPYVNATPHLGYAFELVEADLAARARRAAGEAVRFLGGTDDHSLKNVLAAEAAGRTTRAFVDEHAERFAALAEPLGVSFDDFIRTSSDPRHRPAVERLWAACDRRGDLYRREYEGAYCVGCERFCEPDELVDGRCPEHGTIAETVVETNWFFRLSRYQDQLRDLIETNALSIDPEPFRNEVLAFIRAGLRDISVSRSIERARGWGIGVPGDASQVVYVWFDALTNYISALDFGTDGEQYERWWRQADHRVHVVGKGIQRFHAVYWPSFLLSAGEPVPTRVHVHPYLSVDGAKISKSSGNGPDPTDLTDRFGTDALRWWFTRDVSPITDTDFTVERLIARANDDLANGVGNAVSRIACSSGATGTGSCPTPRPNRSVQRSASPARSTKPWPTSTDEPQRRSSPTPSPRPTATSTRRRHGRSPGSPNTPTASTNSSIATHERLSASPMRSDPSRRRSPRRSPRSSTARRYARHPSRCSRESTTLVGEGRPSSVLRSVLLDVHPVYTQQHSARAARCR